MKPTLWYDGSIWMCSCVDYDILPPEDTEEYIKWACVGAGNSPQEAYANWEHECNLFREESDSDKSNS